MQTIDFQFLIFQFYFQMYFQIHFQMYFQIYFQFVLFLFFLWEPEYLGGTQDPDWRGHCRCFWESLLSDLILLWEFRASALSVDFREWLLRLHWLLLALHWLFPSHLLTPGSHITCGLLLLDIDLPSFDKGCWAQPSSCWSRASPPTLCLCETWLAFQAHAEQCRPAVWQRWHQFVVFGWSQAVSDIDDIGFVPGDLIVWRFHPPQLILEELDFVLVLRFNYAILNL